MIGIVGSAAGEETGIAELYLEEMRGEPVVLNQQDVGGPLWEALWRAALRLRVLNLSSCGLCDAGERRRRRPAHHPCRRCS